MGKQTKAKRRYASLRQNGRSSSGHFIASKAQDKHQLFVEIDDEDDDNKIDEDVEYSDNDSDDEETQESNELETGEECWLVQFVRRLRESKTTVDEVINISKQKLRAHYTGNSTSNMYKKAAKLTAFKNQTEESKKHGQQTLDSFFRPSTGNECQSTTISMLTTITYVIFQVL
jgi:hypothetical protein